MSAPLKLQTIRETLVCPDDNRLTITLADSAGRVQLLSITPELAATLVGILNEFASAADCTGGRGGCLTKLPKNFAVGAGRYEKLVLLRFEDEAPFALSASDAAELGHALVSEAEALAHQPELLCQ